MGNYYQREAYRLAVGGQRVLRDDLPQDIRHIILHCATGIPFTGGHKMDYQHVEGGNSVQVGPVRLAHSSHHAFHRWREESSSL